jgi:tetratricopeptide (TPR) repeat protein
MIQLALLLALSGAPQQAKEAPVPPACVGQTFAGWQACADAAEEDSPAYRLAMINLGTEAYLQNDYATALRFYDKADAPGEEVVSDVLFHSFRADTYRHAGRDADAAEDARTAWLYLDGRPPAGTDPRDLRPVDDSVRFIVLSLILPILKDADPAEFGQARDAYLALPAEDWQSLTTRANALSLIGEHSAAVADSKKAVELQPDDPMLMNNHCYTLVEAGQAAQGLTWCERAAAALPESPHVRHSYAAALAGVGRCADSERQLAEARRLDPSSALYREPIACRAKG